MIDIKWGREISYLSEKRRTHVLRISGNSIMHRNFWLGTKRFFLKWEKKAFAICLPSVVPEGESIKWLFGWRLHDKIDFITDKSDPVIFELHLYKVEVAIYR